MPLPAGASITTALPALLSKRSPLAHTSNAAGLPTNAVWIEATLDRRTDFAVLESYRRKLFALLPIAVLLSAVVGFWIARRGLSPLRSISVALSDVDAESLGNEFQIRGGNGETPIEVGKLLASLDQMRTRLNNRFDVLTRFSSELAHEFRTPIHVLSQQAEIALTHPRSAAEYREVLSSSLEEYERLNRMVDDTLFLARVDDPVTRAGLSQLDTAGELGDVVGFLEAVAVEKGVRLTINGVSPPTVNADRTLLRRALVNVVANAIRHTPAGGEVGIGASPDANAVKITVSDNGPGIDLADLPRVFDRYFRGQDSIDAEGSGLGLSIVKGIMTLHHGTVRITSSRGSGTVVSLIFPD